MRARGPDSDFRLNTLLVHTDFSGASERALRFGIEMARRTGARLILVRITQPLASLDPVGHPEVARISARIVAASRAGLRNIAAQIRHEYGLRVEAANYCGGVAENILRAAYLHDADLVIIGAGENPEGLPRRGSLDLIRNSTLPVLVVGRQGGPVRCEQIVFPYSENPLTLAKTSQVMALAKAFRSGICLLGCTTRRTAMARAALRLRGRRLQEQFRSAGISARLFVVSSPHVDREILNYASRIHAGLIAVVSGGRAGAGPGAASTTGLGVIRSAPVPVLAVPVE